MRRTFQLFELSRFAEFCEFVNGLVNRGKKFTVTPWLQSKDENGGFVVWYHQ